MKPETLWLALHLPCLPLEAHAALPSPSAIVERGRIRLGDRAALEAGVELGMSMAAARALAPTIALLPRDLGREAAALQRLACWAGGYTPRVSLADDALLLEIGSCLRLFGGLERLVAAVQEGVAAQGYSLMLAVAPTPLGAHWLARAGGEVQAQHGTCPLPRLLSRIAGEGRKEASVHWPWLVCRDMAALRTQLESLPLAILPATSADALQRFGARTLADVRRLPAAALGRRIGAATMQLLARAFGELADLRADFVFPERFAMALELPAAVDNAGALLFAARRLTAALAGWLAARQVGLREMTLYLQHGRGLKVSGESAVVLQFADLTASAERFERVLRERLERTALVAPVEALRLEAGATAPRPGRSHALFDDVHAGQEAVGALLERLSARLGAERVYCLAAQADHRPECATRQAAPFGKAASAAAAEDALPQPERPLWLLDPPEALAEIDGAPWRQGRLRLLAGPERIESGWWDGGEAAGQGDVRRDYFIALAADARWLWIYRDCRAPGGWFLHGYFA